MDGRPGQVQTPQAWGFVRVRIRALAKGEELELESGASLVLVAGAVELHRPGQAVELVLADDQGAVRIAPMGEGGSLTALSPAKLALYSERRGV